jgi:16S rRNA (cytidine1402-2'-O)-methyltransferase
VRVVPIPGPSAVAAALSISGFSANEFAFMGFVPRSGKEREDWLRRLKGDSRVIVFFEAPHRIERTLAELNIGKRPIVVCREITKKHEQLVISATTVAAPMPSKGEFTVVVGQEGSNASANSIGTDIVDIFGRLTDHAGLSEEMALKIIDMTFHVGPSAVRKAVKRHLISVKQQNAGQT